MARSNAYNREEIRRGLVAALARATALEPAFVARNLVRPDDRGRGDHSFRCFPLVRLWNLPPSQCAANVAAVLELPTGIARVDPVGGYLNFFEDRREVGKRIIEAILA